MLYLLGVLFFVVAIAVSIGLHELGHLTTAKIFRVRCPQYFVGFGPTLWSRTVGETEYGVKAIPFGGFVSMVGAYPPHEEDPDARPPRTAIGRWARQVAQDTREADAENVLPTDADRVIYRLPWWKQCIIYLAGPVVNLVIATAVIGGIVVLHGIPEPTTTVGTIVTCLKTEGAAERQTCQDGDPRSPGAEAGLRPGDRIQAVDGAAVARWEDLTQVIRDHPGEKQRWTVLRDGAEQQLTVIPRVTERLVYGPDGRPVLDEDGKPRVTRVGYVGVGPTVEPRKASPAEVPPLIGRQLWQTGVMVVRLPQKLWGIGASTVNGTPRDPNGPMSIVGTGRISGEIIEGGRGPSGGVDWSTRALAFLGLMAGLNMALFVFNMIPLLPLDGGHVAMALWQALKRGAAKVLHRPDPGFVDKAKAMPFALGVFGVFILMTIFLVVADLVNPVRLTG